MNDIQDNDENVMIIRRPKNKNILCSTKTL